MKFRFQVQECLDIFVDATNAEEGRRKVIAMLERGDIEFNDPYVSDGKEVK